MKSLYEKFAFCLILFALNFFLGQNKKTIIIPHNAKVYEQKAAKDLSDYIYIISGQKLEILDESKVVSDTAQNFLISVGNTKEAFKNNFVSTSFKELNRDGIVIYSDNNNLFLLGNGSRGTLYSIYEYLEKYLGCRFWTPSFETIPKKSDFIVKNIKYKYSPPFYYRDFYTYNTVTSPVFSVKCKNNGQHSSLSESLGGAYEIQGWEHTFTHIISPEEYFSKFPEWFTDVSNQNLPCTKYSAFPDKEKVQLCLTNPALKKELVNKLRKTIIGNDQIIALSQMDNNNFCECVQCQRVKKEEGGQQSGVVLRFVNDIAKEFVDTKFETLAYMATLTPPLKAKPLPNVLVRFASLEKDNGRPFTSPTNKDIKERVIGWHTISKSDLLYSGYNSNFNNLLYPYPTLGIIGTDLKFLYKNNYRGIFIQSNKYTGNIGFLLDLNCWVISKLLWDPSLNEDELVNEFVKNYYNNSDALMKQYYNLIRDKFLQSNVKLAAYTLNYSFLDKKSLQQSRGFLSKALNLANSELVKQRIKKEILAFDLFYYSVEPSQITSQNLYNKKVDMLFKSIDSLGVEDVDMVYSKIQVKEKMKKSYIITSQQKNYSKTGDWIVKEQFLNYYKLNELSGTAEVNSATDKIAAYIKSSSQDWSLQFFFNTMMGSLNDSIKINKISANIMLGAVEKGEDCSTCIVRMGVVDQQENKHIKVINIPYSDLSETAFKTISIENVYINNNRFLWFAIIDNKGVRKVYVDDLKLTR